LIQDLEALECRLARMAPDDAPTGIPSNPALRKQFYRWIALSRPAAAGDLVQRPGLPPVSGRENHLNHLF
jgi:hypothetical protein